jgi:hypothetical protein
MLLACTSLGVVVCCKPVREERDHVLPDPIAEMARMATVMINPGACSLPVSSPETLSFTYGDSFPAMRVQDGRPYRGQVYTLAELPALIAAFGLPQEWKRDGQDGPERYIEAQLWDDTPPLISLAVVSASDEPDAGFPAAEPRPRYSP